MKGVKGRFLKKLKSIPLRPITSLNPGRVLQANGFLDPLPHDSINWVFQNPPALKAQDQNTNSHGNLPVLQPDIDIEELMRDLEDEETEEMELGGDDVGNKENIRPPLKARDPLTAKENSDSPFFSESESCNLRNGPLAELDISSFRRSDTAPAKNSSEIPNSSECGTSNLWQGPLTEIDISSFRRPDMNSWSLFDPNLLAAFQQAVMEHMRANEVERKASIEQLSGEKEEEPPTKVPRIEDNPLLEFEEKCPPGGSDSVILYTTSLRGIRKTFEGCCSIRFLLGSFRILFYERDVSMHLEFREELWRILGGRVVPPRLFIKGRYIGGADEVVSLHEQGKLRQLLQGVPMDHSDGPCECCSGIRFVLCFNCCGSCRVSPGTDGSPTRCPECNENGLIICPLCC